MRSTTLFALGMALASALISGDSSASAQGKKPGGGGGGTPAYQVVRLSVPGAVRRQANDLNDQGNVVGEFNDAGGMVHGFHYELASNTYLSLGAGVTAAGVNRLDEIVGTDEIASVGLYWSSPDAGPVPLLPLARHTHSEAVALNDAGIIIGSSYIPEDAPVTPGFRAVVAWHVNLLGVVSGPVELPYLAGDIVGQANDLTEAANGLTTIVGTSGWDSSRLPVSWMVAVAGEGFTVIGPAEFDGAYVLADPWRINNLGDAVGIAAFMEGGAGMPFLRRAGQSVLPLPILPNAVSGSATAINDGGRIVGGQFVELKGQGLVRRAVLWTSPTTVVDLNSLVSLGRSESLPWCLRINSSGVILATINGHTPCLLIPK